MSRSAAELQGGAAHIVALLLLGVMAAAPCVHAQDQPKQYESNFGRVILAGSDMIVQGVAAAQRSRVSAGFKVEVTVQAALYGETKLQAISLFYTDDNLLKKGQAVRALFAVKKMAAGGFSLVGKPVLMPEGELESEDKRKVCEEFVALESLEDEEQRTSAFWELLLRHVRKGGYYAQNAAVELMFIARDRGSIITEDRFTKLRDAETESLAVLTKQCRNDLALAMQGMVEARVKTFKVKRIRGDDKADRKVAADELAALVKAYPRAFTEGDAKLLEAMRDDTKDPQLRGKLDDIRQAIITEVRIREARERG
jgi:hypothetical protein